MPEKRRFNQNANFCLWWLTIRGLDKMLNDNSCFPICVIPGALLKTAFFEFPFLEGLVPPVVPQFYRVAIVKRGEWVVVGCCVIVSELSGCVPLRSLSTISVAMTEFTTSWRNLLNSASVLYMTLRRSWNSSSINNLQATSTEFYDGSERSDVEMSLW